MSDPSVYAKIEALSKQPDPAAKIVVAIWSDVTDRKGWRHEHDRFDPDIQCEIVDTWLTKVEQILEQSK